MGKSKKANATVAITIFFGKDETRTKNIKRNHHYSIQKEKDLLAVQTANNSCIESKKKNMINNDIEAPKGKHSACIVSNVANLPGIREKDENVLVYVT